MTLLLEHFSTKMDIGGKCKKKKVGGGGEDREERVVKKVLN
jgi:hypothetical protein